MNNYANSKKELDTIRSKYSCQGDVMFRTALSTVLECGQNTFKDDKWFDACVTEIRERHENFRKEGKHFFMTEDFELAIANCAREIAFVNTGHVFMYVQREIWSHDGFGDISYKRAIELLQSTVSYALQDRETDVAKEDLEFIGFEDEELCELGFEDVFFYEDKE